MVLTPEHAAAAANVPVAGVWRSALLEAVLSFLLMFVILRVATGPKEKGIIAGVAIGGTVALCILMGGPASGASMNPARSLGPALATATFGGLWVYLTAPFLGAALAVPAHRAVGVVVPPGVAAGEPRLAGDPRPVPFDCGRQDRTRRAAARPVTAASARSSTNRAARRCRSRRGAAPVPGGRVVAHVRTPRVGSGDRDPHPPVEIRRGVRAEVPRHGDGPRDPRRPHAGPRGHRGRRRFADGAGGPRAGPRTHPASPAYSASRS